MLRCGKQYGIRADFRCSRDDISDSEWGVRVVTSRILQCGFLTYDQLLPLLGASGGGGGGGGVVAPGAAVPAAGPSAAGVSAILSSASIRSRARTTFDWR